MFTIAIDGPSGAGKSTVAKLIAQKLNITYLDTGAMYRAVALKAIRLNIDPADEKAVSKFLDDTKIEIQHFDKVQHVLLDDTDVSLEIRQHFISKAASDISKHKAVRLKLVALQQEIAKKTDVVMDGRDIASYVLPDANYKFFLTASAEERANRRYKELTQKGEKCNYNDILKDIKLRDENDIKREFAPLKKAADAIEIDSTNLSLDEVVKKILSYIKMKK